MSQRFKFKRNKTGENDKSIACWEPECLTELNFDLDLT